MPLQHFASDELDDYSGPFEPDLRIQDFSKEGLIKLVQIGGEIYGAVNRQWYAKVAERFGQEAADELHHEVWFADGEAGDHENYTISRLMGFAGEDEVTTPMKVWQCLPAMNTRMTLKLPPRRAPDEPHCRWSITKQDQPVDDAADPGDYVAAHGLGRVTDIELVNYEAGKYRRDQVAR